MANSKISALTSASTPLAGTETLPIVQSGATVKVPTNDLTVRNIRAAATTGILQVSGPTAGTTRTATVPDANWVAARTDAAQSFTGDQTLSTGNLVQGVAAKGVNFTANTPSSGMTSELLNWYEEGIFTPTFEGTTTPGVGTYSTQVGRHTRIGNLVRFAINLRATSHTGTGNLIVVGLPFSSASSPTGRTNVLLNCQLLTYGSGIPFGYINDSSSLIILNLQTSNAASSAIAMDVDAWVFIQGTYQV
jgi:hypothetical protein